MFKICLKIFFLLVAISIFGLGVVWIYWAVKVHGIIKEMERPLVESAVDFSGVHQYEFTLPPVQDYFHGLGIWIEIESGGKQEEELEEYLTDLKGSILVQAEDEILSCVKLDDDSFYGYLDQPYKEEGPNRAFLMLMDQFWGHESQASQLTIQIDQPAEQLSGIEQTLQVKYKLCGCEHVARLYSSIFGIIAIFVGLLIGVPIICSLLSGKNKIPVLADEQGQTQ